jgi:hypothetical protein
MKRAARLMIAFAGMVLAIEALRVAVAWWRGDMDSPGLAQWLMLASLPALAWAWWRFLSPFGRGRCLLPSDKD